MINPYDTLEAAKERKAVDDPKCRVFDPDCWKCLSDEQRDIINEWYFDRLIKDKKEAEKENNSKETLTSLIQFIFVGWSFAFFFGAWEQLFAGQYFSFLKGLICACVFSLFVTGIGTLVADTAHDMGTSKVALFGGIIFFLLIITGMIL